MMLYLALWVRINGIHNCLNCPSFWYLPRPKCTTHKNEGRPDRTMTTILIHKPELPGLRLGSRETPLKQELQNRVGKSKSIQQIQNRVSNRKSNQPIGNRVSKYKIDSRRTHRVQSTVRYQKGGNPKMEQNWSKEKCKNDVKIEFEATWAGILASIFIDPNPQ